MKTLKGQETEIGLWVTLHEWDHECHPHSKACKAWRWRMKKQSKSDPPKNNCLPVTMEAKDWFGTATLFLWIYFSEKTTTFGRMYAELSVNQQKLNCYPAVQKVLLDERFVCKLAVPSKMTKLEQLHKVNWKTFHVFKIKMITVYLFEGQITFLFQI